MPSLTVNGFLTVNVTTTIMMMMILIMMIRMKRRSRRIGSSSINTKDYHSEDYVLNVLAQAGYRTM